MVSTESTLAITLWLCFGVNSNYMCTGIWSWYIDYNGVKSITVTEPSMEFFVACFPPISSGSLDVMYQTPPKMNAIK